MESVATQQLRALQWATITHQLQTLAASWARLRVDHLPTPGENANGPCKSNNAELLEATTPELRRGGRARSAPVHAAAGG